MAFVFIEFINSINMITMTKTHFHTWDAFHIKHIKQQTVEQYSKLS